MNQLVKGRFGYVCDECIHEAYEVLNEEEEEHINKENKDISDVQPSDIIRFGLTPELVGRLPVICTLKPLEEEDLLRILTEPKNVLVKQCQKLMSFDDIELEFTDDALKRIANLALERKIGARGLRAIIEKCMEKVMFAIPDVKDAKKVVINADVVNGKSEAIVYGKANKKIA